MRSAKIRVIVVDDSALVRTMLADIINKQTDMVCVATASDPYVAREVIREKNPDVITLDIEMPRMDGLNFLRQLMRLRPMPVVMISTLTERGAEATLKAMELGAVDFVEKPRMGLSVGLQELSAQIVEKIRVAATSKVKRLQSDLAPEYGPLPAGVAPVELAVSGRLLGGYLTEKIIFIGASTGGTEAIKDVLIKMPADSPAIVITQHMPAGFTASFAKRLDSLCQIAVKEASDGERLLQGHAYIAPGGRQFHIGRSGANYVAVVDDAAPVNRHKPSVEVLFRSGAQCVGKNAIAVMLTGMGADGAAAMKQMKDAGSYNFVQDESTCVVFGMPREAIACGAADEVLPLSEIAPAILDRLRAIAGSQRYRI